MELETVLFIILGLFVLLILTIAGLFSPAKAKAKVDGDAMPLPVKATALPSMQAGFSKAARVFFILGLVFGTVCFFLVPPIGAFAASGLFSLAFIFWVLSLCFK